MDSFRARRHTAILALVAIAVSAGIFTLALVTVVSLGAYLPDGRASGLAVAGDPAPRQQASTAGKSDFVKSAPVAQPELMATRLAAAILPSPADMKGLNWQNDLDWLRTRASATPSAFDVPAWQTASLPLSPAVALPPSAAPAPVAQVASAPAAPVQVAPVQAAPVQAAPVQGAPAPAQVAAVSQPAANPDEPATDQAAITAAVPVVKPRLRVADPAREPGPKPHRVASSAPRSYTEKVVEQGDSGDVSFRYRRRACTPGHMVDVCYMPAADRQRIVIERY
jgi:hypothetical protein